MITLSGNHKARSETGMIYVLLFEVGHFNIHSHTV